MALEIISLILGLAVMAYASDKGVKYSLNIATELKVPSIIIGLVLVSFGTNVAEIANSLFSSFIQHGDINAGDTIGSSLSQITLVLGLVAILSSKRLKAERKDTITLASATVIALSAAAFALSDSMLDRFDAILLILSYAGLLILISRSLLRGKEHGGEMKGSILKAGALFLLSMAFVALGAIIVVNSTISLSEILGLPEFIVSFFSIGIGTSLPELSVQLSAARKGKFGLILGDAFGSTITDSTLALAIGPLLFPTKVSGEVIIPLVSYAIAAAVLVGVLLYLRKMIDRKAALILVAVYLLSFLVGQAGFSPQF